MTPHLLSLPTTCLVILAAGLGSGCQSQNRPVTASTVEVRSELTIRDGNSDAILTWEEFLDRTTDVDVIVLGEEHDDATGHAVQLAVVEDVMDRRGGGTLALEMLERDEQILVDDHADGIIDAEALAKATRSTDWAGTGSWVAWYQPIIDAALKRDGHVVAANAPRRYVRLARRDGWEAVESLPANRAEFATIPPEPIDGVYRERFFEVMQPESHGDEEGVEETAGTEPDLSYIEPFYRAQQVWDATMAESVAESLRVGGPPVILLVGRFHSDHHGGTVRELERRLPDHSILVVSLETERGDPLVAGQDIPQADVIVFTRSNKP